MGRCVGERIRVVEEFSHRRLAPPEATRWPAQRKTPPLRVSCGVRRRVRPAIGRLLPRPSSDSGSAIRRFARAVHARSARSARRSRDDQVDGRRERDHRDADPDLVVGAVPGQPPDRLERNRRRPDQDEHSLERRGQVLDLVVAVAMAVVRGFPGDPHRDERDERSDQVDARVDRLGENSDRAGQRSGDQLQQDQDGVRKNRQRGGPRLQPGVCLWGHRPVGATRHRPVGATRHRPIRHLSVPAATWQRREVRGHGG